MYLKHGWQPKWRYLHIGQPKLESLFQPWCSSYGVIQCIRRRDVLHFQLIYLYALSTTLHLLLPSPFPLNFSSFTWYVDFCWYADGCQSLWWLVNSVSGLWVGYAIPVSRINITDLTMDPPAHCRHPSQETQADVPTLARTCSVHCTRVYFCSVETCF